MAVVRTQVFTMLYNNLLARYFFLMQLKKKKMIFMRYFCDLLPCHTLEQMGCLTDSDIAFSLFLGTLNGGKKKKTQPYMPCIRSAEVPQAV